jgi:hypothetical protein
MRISTILLAGAVLSLVGCEASPLAVGPSNQTAATAVVSQAQGVAPVVSLKQTSSGQLISSGSCGAGVLLVSVPGTGVASHIGRFEIDQTNCLNGTTGAVTNGVATLVAANGDEVHMTYDGQTVALAPQTLDLDYVITGGTGRFASAEGALDMRVILTSPTTWTSTGSGWIQYAASDRSNL